MPESRNSVFRDDTINSYELKQHTTNDNGVLKRNIDLSDDYDTCVLVFIGDWHIGTVDFDINEAIKVINYVLQTPNARLLCLGDMMNTAILNSVSNMFEDIAYPQEQWKVFVSLLKQVANQQKLVVIHTGNHERRIGRNTGMDPVEQAASALDAQETHAPYYADTCLTLKSHYTKSGKYAFPIITHHGDSGNPENNATINQESLINGIGHTHTFKAYTKTKIIINKNGKRVKKDELNIVIPASGGGQYGYEKGYRPLNKCPYYAIEVTSVENPLYDSSNPSNMQQAVILATKSISILSQAPTENKQNCIKQGMKVIDKGVKDAKALYIQKLFEILEIFESCGAEIDQKLKTALARQIIKDAKSKKSGSPTKNSPKKIGSSDWYIHDEIKE